MQFNGPATEHFAAFWLCRSAGLCLHYSTDSLASKDNYVKRRSWRLTEWEIMRFDLVVFPLCNHTDDHLSFLACVQPVYLCLGCDCLHFKPYSTFLVFCRVEVPVYIKCLPYNILPVTFIHFPPFLPLFSVLTVGFTSLFYLYQLSIYFLLILLFWITASFIRTSIRSKYCVLFAFTY